MHIKNVTRQTFIGVNWMILMYPILTVLLLREYLQFQSINFILGMLALLFSRQVINTGNYSSRYAWLTLVMISLCWLMPVKTLLYFAICLCLIFFVECFIGKLNLLAPLTMFLMSPVFQYLVSTFSFPIRLSLSQLAGKLFNTAGAETTVSGNVISMGGNEYSVDSACMGLQMMEASLLLGVLLILLFQKQYQRKLHLGYTVLFFLLIVLLNIVCNLMRIMILVLFNIPAETIGHELAGILCLFIYVFLPAIWLGRRIVNRFPACDIQKSKTAGTIKRIATHLIFLISLLVLGYRVNSVDTYAMTPGITAGSMNGYTISEYTPGILKLQDDRSLVYLKYTRGFFDTDHSPVLCWSGSGYVFQKVEKKKIGHVSVYTGILEKGNDRLYTAWWFDNGVSKTINPISWRWDMMKGANNYAVVNVTCSNPVVLAEEIKRLINTNRIKPLLINSNNKS